MTTPKFESRKISQNEVNFVPFSVVPIIIIIIITLTTWIQFSLISKGKTNFYYQHNCFTQSRFTSFQPFPEKNTLVYHTSDLSVTINFPFFHIFQFVLLAWQPFIKFCIRLPHITQKKRHILTAHTQRKNFPIHFEKEFLIKKSTPQPV